MMATNGKSIMAYFISTVRYNKMQENGQVKTVNGTYLVDAATVTDAEARTTDYIAPYITGDFTIPSVKRSRIAEVFASEGYYWLCKVAFITIDEKSGAEKKSISQILVQADDFDSAVTTFKEGMKGTLADYELQSIALSKVVEFIH